MVYEPRLPQQWLAQPHQVVYSDNPIRLRLSNFKIIHRKLQENLKLSQDKMIDRRQQEVKSIEYKVGDEVYISNERREGPGYKLSHKFIGPFSVIDSTDIKVKIRRNQEEPFWLHKDRCKKTHSREEDETDSMQVESPLQEHVEANKTKGKRVNFKSPPKQSTHRYALRSKTP